MLAQVGVNHTRRPSRRAEAIARTRQTTTLPPAAVTVSAHTVVQPPRPPPRVTQRALIRHRRRGGRVQKCQLQSLRRRVGRIVAREYRAKATDARVGRRAAALHQIGKTGHLLTGAARSLPPIRRRVQIDVAQIHLSLGREWQRTPCRDVKGRRWQALTHLTVIIRVDHGSRRLGHGGNHVRRVRVIGCRAGIQPLGR